MAWKVEKSADGLPVWSGFDSIFNQFGHVEFQTATVRFFAPIIALMAFALGGGLVFAPNGLPDPIYYFLWLVTAFFAWLAWTTGRYGKEFKSFGSTSAKAATLGALSGLRVEKDNKPFLHMPWRFTVGPDGLTYRGAESWTVDLADVSRVETAKTHEWQKVRDLSPYVPTFKGDLSSVAVPAEEYQTFLVLRDTSRRVIYTANADREGCATLAHSIREYLESVRPASAPAVAAGPAASPAGFDL